LLHVVVVDLAVVVVVAILLLLVDTCLRFVLKGVAMLVVLLDVVAAVAVRVIDVVVVDRRCCWCS
jgi:hypothetical protein